MWHVAQKTGNRPKRFDRIPLAVNDDAFGFSLRIKPAVFLPGKFSSVHSLGFDIDRAGQHLDARIGATIADHLHDMQQAAFGDRQVIIEQPGVTLDRLLDDREDSSLLWVTSSLMPTVKRFLGSLAVMLS